MGVCSDPTVDDVAFIEKIVKDLPKRIKSEPGVVSESAGPRYATAVRLQSVQMCAGVFIAI